MDQLNCILDEIITKKIKDSPQFYTALVNLLECDYNKSHFEEVLLPKIYVLFKRNFLEKSIVYWILLSLEQFELLESFIDYDKKLFKLDIYDSNSLFTYCLYTRNHWLPAILNSNFEDFISNPAVLNKLKIIRIINDTNYLQVNINELKRALHGVNRSEVPDIWLCYLKNIDKTVEVTQICQTISRSQNEAELFNFAKINSPLRTLSKYTDLTNKANWTTFEDFLLKHGEFNESKIWVTYTILDSIINLIKEGDYKADINIFFEEIKQKVFSINNLHIQVELLENIFSLLFYENGTFLCREKDVRFVLSLLKSVIDELKLQGPVLRAPEQINKLNTLYIHITDALWRLELLFDVNTPEDLADKLIFYMVSPPDSLIRLCLKKENFLRANQVVEIFDIGDSELALQVNTMQELSKFRKCIRSKREFEAQLDEGKNFDITLFDILLTEEYPTHNSYELVEKYTNLETPDYLKNFIYRLSDVIQQFESTEPPPCISEILTNYELNGNIRTKEDFYANLKRLCGEFQDNLTAKGTGFLNKNHPVHKTFLKLAVSCSEFSKESEGNVEYLKRTFNYLKSFAKIFYIEENTSDIISKGKLCSFFSFLEYNRSELIGKLLFEKKLDPTEFEIYFGKLKLDFLYHIVGNCFPTINLHVQDNLTLEELYHDNMLYTPNESIILYIQKRNWLLAFILNEMYEIGCETITSEARLRTFFNYLNLKKIDYMKSLFEGNKIIASLQNFVSLQKIKGFIQEHMMDIDLTSINSQNIADCEIAEDILKKPEAVTWKLLYNILESLPEIHVQKTPEFASLRDKILVNIVQERTEECSENYIYFISNRDRRIEVILRQIRKLPAGSAIEVINLELGRPGAPKQLSKWVKIIELHEQFRIFGLFDHWYQSYEFCGKNPEEALHRILENDVNLLWSFVEVHNPTLDINFDDLLKLFEANVEGSEIWSILERLPLEETIENCDILLNKLQNISHLNFVAKYLKHKASNMDLVGKIEVSLKILSRLDPDEQLQMFSLIKEPLIILEMLIMNAKFDKLGLVLKDLDHTALDTRELDNMLRNYAQKSLVCTITVNHKLRRSDELLQSVDTDRKKFVIPDSVPSKDEWVQNDEIVECMCCQQTIFSMFNRRHHCRRCGRVICYNCSLKRTLVPSYGDIAVRVCDDCYANGSLNESFYPQEWILKDNMEHNKIVREEFSYEHAPNTSLCFSILRYHSKNSEYASFLLDECEKMMRLLQPTDLTPEIDYLLVIRMIKSLAMCAKIISTECMFGSGVTISEKILSQADILALLAERGCLKIISSIGIQSHYFHSINLRRLRDKLLQDEQWHLALELSTKAGLDNTGIFAAWGKNCLRAGSFQLAREKFQRCLDKNIDSISSSSRFSETCESGSRYCSRSSTSSVVSIDVKPSKDPPLLNEIIQILENSTRVLDCSTSGSTLSLYNANESAINIIERLKVLKTISKGEYNITQPQRNNAPVVKPKIPEHIYEECIFYIKKYGTHSTLLSFFIAHGDFKNCLLYITENALSEDHFIEIYMKCLKIGLVAGLQAQMSRMDSSLSLWKDYLKRTCRFLEQQQLMNCLYQLQIYIGDYIRAAMTCLKFYQENVKKFTELANNASYLLKVKEHLKQMVEQEQWVEVASVDQANSHLFEERTISNPDLVMKITNADIHRHIVTVKRQLSLVKFLADCENNGLQTIEALRELPSETHDLPTLFGPRQEKINLVVLCIVSERQKGFDMAIQLMDEFKLKPLNIYCACAKILAKFHRYDGITALVNCIKASGNQDNDISDMLDEVLGQAVVTLVNINVTGTKVEDLIKLIQDTGLKISAYIQAKQLKTAFFLAVKYKRIADLRRIQREAELLNMPTIRALCMKYLQTGAA